MTGKNKTIKELQLEVDEWIKSVGKGYFSPLTNMAILTEEVGELARSMSRVYGEQSFKQGEQENIGEELSDILFVVMCLANQTNISLEDAFKKKMVVRTNRDADRHKNNPKIQQ